MNRLTSIIRSTSVLIKIWPRFNCFFFLSNIWNYFKLWGFILTKDNENLLGSGLVGPGSSRVERLISEMRNLTRWVDSGSKITGRRGERREECGRGSPAIAVLLGPGLGHLGSEENLGGGGAGNVSRGSFDCQPHMIESSSTNELFILRLIVIINNNTPWPRSGLRNNKETQSEVLFCSYLEPERE